MTVITLTNNIYITNLVLVQEDGTMFIGTPYLLNGELVRSSFTVIPLADIKSAEYNIACSKTYFGVINSHYKNKPKK